MKFSRCLLAGALLLLASSRFASADEEPLTADDVTLIVAQAATKAAAINSASIIAVTDREGFLLALWDVSGRLPHQLPAFPLPLPPTPVFSPAALELIKAYGLAAGAVSRASTAAFLSSNNNAFTSRTAGFIIQQHFPPGVRNTPPGPLVGVGFSSLFYSDVNRVKLIPQGYFGGDLVSPTTSPGVRAPLFPLTSLSDSPGGVPLFKNGRLAGGIGVTGDNNPSNLTPAAAIFFKETQRNATAGFKTGRDDDEDIALAGQTGFRPPSDILADNVLIGGIRVPYVGVPDDQIQDQDHVAELDSVGRSIDIPYGALPANGSQPAYPAGVASGRPQASPAAYPYPTTTLKGVSVQIRFPFRDDPVAAVPGRQKIGKAARLTASDVQDIIGLAARRAKDTRAGIRLPIGVNMEAFICVVNNPARAGEAPQILGVIGTEGEATIFSWDVAVQKARTALFFSNRQLAFSSRTVGFLSERFFPPGIDGRPWGPLFGFQEAISLRRSPPNPDPTKAFQFPGNSNLPNGETIFPGGFPLYHEGYVVGAIGVSGDGVDQDDITAASGCANFLAPMNIRADTYAYRGARLPYAKFPRDPQK